MQTANFEIKTTNKSLFSALNNVTLATINSSTGFTGNVSGTPHTFQTTSTSGSFEQCSITVGANTYSGSTTQIMVYATAVSGSATTVSGVDYYYYGTGTIYIYQGTSVATGTSILSGAFTSAYIMDDNLGTTRSVRFKVDNNNFVYTAKTITTPNWGYTGNVDMVLVGSTGYTYSAITKNINESTTGGTLEGTFSGYLSQTNQTGSGFSPKAGTYEFCTAPFISTVNTGILANNTQVMQATNQYIMAILKFNEDIPIAGLGWRITAISSPSGFNVQAGVALFNTSTGNVNFTGSSIDFITSTTITTGFTVGWKQATFPSTTLIANTLYGVGIQISARTSGSITVASHMGNNYNTQMRWPSMRVVSGAVTTVQKPGGEICIIPTSASGIIGYYGYPFTQNDAFTYHTATSGTTQPQLGMKHDLQFPADGIYVTKIGVQAERRNANHSLVMRIYATDNSLGYTDTENYIAQSNISSFSRDVITFNLTRIRIFYFSPPVLIRPFKNYYYMLDVIAGTATNTNPTQLSIPLFNNYTIDPWKNPDPYQPQRKTTEAALPTAQTNGHIFPAVIWFETEYDTPRPQTM